MWRQFLVLCCVFRASNAAPREESWPFDFSKPETFEFSQYHSYDEIIELTKSLESKYPSKASQVVVGTSTEGRAIVGLKVSTTSENPKPAIYIDGGIHARDWLTTGVVLYLMEELVIRSETDTRLFALVNKLDWYLIPTVNPDGYEYSRSDEPEARAWLKNRSKQSCSFYGCCYGVNLNRNFDAKWNAFGTSNDSCDNDFPGQKAFSELEAQAIRDTIRGLQDRLKAMITLHAYGQSWLIPFGNEFPPKYPADYEEMETAAQAATAAIRAVHGSNYIAQNGALTSLYAGAADDWTKQTYPDVTYVYTVEVRPEEDSVQNYDVPPSNIIPAGEEIFAGIKVIAQRIIAPVQPQK